jgi:hypothetical protein
MLREGMGLRRFFHENGFTAGCRPGDPSPPILIQQVFKPVVMPFLIGR